MDQIIYRGRFAPTPSGPLHFGSLVAATGSYLDARSRRGEWHVRIDDHDSLRVAPGAIESILHCLETLGFEWDGPVLYQSKRRPAYHAALHRLRQLGPIYPCACTRKEVSDSAIAGVEGPVYPGTCRDTLPPGRPARALRMCVQGMRIDFHDRLLGPQHIDLEREVGDFILYRADGVYAFHLASAVDDGEYGMTDVVRGADLLESSARQIQLLRLLGLPVPHYVHLPVAVDQHGEKLSKQTKAAPVDPTRPLLVLRAVLRFLNHTVPDDVAEATVPELWRYAVDHWDLLRVGPRLQGRAVD